MLLHCLLWNHHSTCFIPIICRVARGLQAEERRARLTLPNNTVTEASISISPKAKTCDPLAVNTGGKLQWCKLGLLLEKSAFPPGMLLETFSDESFRKCTFLLMFECTDVSYLHIYRIEKRLLWLCASCWTAVIVKATLWFSCSQSDDAFTAISTCVFFKLPFYVCYAIKLQNVVVILLCWHLVEF